MLQELANSLACNAIFGTSQAFPMPSHIAKRSWLDPHFVPRPKLQGLGVALGSCKVMVVAAC